MPRWLRKTGEFLAEEFRLLLPPTIYFFCAFNLIVFTTNLMVRHYWFALSQFLFASTMALIVGKVILVARRLPLLERFKDAPLIVPIVYKTVLYNLLVASVRVLEELGHMAFDARGFGVAWKAAAQEFTWHHFAAVQIWLSVTFLIYVGFVELSVGLGKGRLRKLLFIDGRSEAR